jgi:hypothetical protein
MNRSRRWTPVKRPRTMHPSVLLAIFGVGAYVLFIIRLLWG